MIDAVTCPSCGAAKADEALAATREGLALYERKGATYWVDRTQRLIDDWAA